MPRAGCASGTPWLITLQPGGKEGGGDSARNSACYSRSAASERGEGGFRVALHYEPHVGIWNKTFIFPWNANKQAGQEEREFKFLLSAITGTSTSRSLPGKIKRLRYSEQRPTLVVPEKCDSFSLWPSGPSCKKTKQTIFPLNSCFFPLAGNLFGLPAFRSLGLNHCCY